MAYSYQQRIHADIFRAVCLFCAFHVTLSAPSSEGNSNDEATSSDCMMETLQASGVFNASGVYNRFKANELDEWILSTLTFNDADKALLRNGFTSALTRFTILQCLNHEYKDQVSSPEACRLFQGPCGHGLCNLNPSSMQYSCRCNRGFRGLACQEELNECDLRRPCLNGATCEDRVNNYTCHCADGFFGKHCETDRNECASSPCDHGNCIDVVNGYRCECDAGYTGPRCDEDIDECISSPCQHGGQCEDGVDSYACVCQPGYTGLRCEKDINECASQPCQNFATCHDSVNGYMCHCFHGYKGVNCEKETLNETTIDRILEMIDRPNPLKTLSDSKVKQLYDTGPTFIRWGRASCPNTSHILYHGLAAADHHNHKGSGGNPLCLPDDPVYERYAGATWGGTLYGAQYQMQGQNQPYSNSFTHGDIPCAVCEAKGKKTTFMLPARNLCPSNWVREYHGYLMSSHHRNNKYSAQYLCFDDAIEKAQGMGSHSGGSHFFPVAVQNGYGLRAPPYVNQRELTCAVCSK